MLLRRQITGFALLALIAAPLLFVAGFLIKQQLVQHEMKQQLEQSALQTIQLDAGKINWVKEGKEILVDGKLFDVKIFIIAANKITLTGLFDYNEDALKLQLEKLAQKQNANPVNQTAIGFFFIPVYTEYGFQFSAIAWNLITCKHPLYSSQIPEAPPSSLLKPPQI